MGQKPKYTMITYEQMQKIDKKSEQVPLTLDAVNEASVNPALSDYINEMENTFEYKTHVKSLIDEEYMAKVNLMINDPVGYRLNQSRYR